MPALKDLLRYDPETGNIYWRVDRWPVRAGAVAGTPHVRGYVSICVDRRMWLAHRLAWFLYTGEEPKGQIDHINGVKTDNRWSNLRLASQAQNSANSPRRVNNKSGFKGVSATTSNKWAAYIRREGKTYYLGTFARPEEAHIAYVAAAREAFGEFARAE